MQVGTEGQDTWKEAGSLAPHGAVLAPIRTQFTRIYAEAGSTAQSSVHPAPTGMFQASRRCSAEASGNRR